MRRLCPMVEEYPDMQGHKAAPAVNNILLAGHAFNPRQSRVGCMELMLSSDRKSVLANARRKASCSSGVRHHVDATHVSSVALTARCALSGSGAGAAACRSASSSETALAMP